MAAGIYGRLLCAVGAMTLAAVAIVYATIMVLSMVWIWWQVRNAMWEVETMRQGRQDNWYNTWSMWYVSQGISNMWMVQSSFVAAILVVWGAVIGIMSPSYLIMEANVCC